MPPREPVEIDDDEPLELTPDMEADADAEADETEGEPPAIEGDEEDEGDEETVVGFEDEAEAGSEDDTPVIRRMRERLKVLNRENQELRKGDTQRQEADLGPKPTLQDCDYDEDEYDRRRDEWLAKKQRLETTTQSREREAQAAEREWAQDMDAYASKRDALALPDFEDAAETVKDALSIAQQAVIIKAANNPAAFVYGLSRSDARLAELAKIRDPLKFAAAVARMEGGLKVVKRRRTPAPDRPTKGSSKLPGGTDKQLDKLEAEAQKSGNRTAVLAYKRKLARSRK